MSYMEIAQPLTGDPTIASKKELLMLAWQFALEDLEGAGITWELWQKRMLVSHAYREQFVRRMLGLYSLMLTTHGMVNTGELGHWAALSRFDSDQLMQAFADLTDNSMGVEHLNTGLNGEPDLTHEDR